MPSERVGDANLNTGLPPPRKGITSNNKTRRATSVQDSTFIFGNCPFLFGYSLFFFVSVLVFKNTWDEDVDLCQNIYVLRAAAAKPPLDAIICHRVRKQLVGERNVRH